MTGVLCDKSTPILPKESVVSNISSTGLCQLNTLETWKLLSPDLTQLHGVKFMDAINNDIEVNSVIGLNTDTWALQPKYCVNPNDLTLQKNLKTESVVHSYSLNIKVQAQDNTYMVSPNQHSLTKQDYVVLKSNKSSVDLENFQDITKWCQTKIDAGLIQQNQNMTAPDSIDELNIPVLELDEFLFVQPTSIDNSDMDCYDLLKTLRSNSDIDISNTGMNLENVMYIMGEPQINNGDNKNANYNISNNNNEELIYNNLNHVSGGRLMENIQKTIVNEDNNIRYLSEQIHKNSNTIDNAEVILDVDSVQNYVDINSEDSFAINVIDVPPYRTDVKQNISDPKDLKLDFSNIFVDNSVPSIDTPEVIKTALSLDQEGFNLCNFINNEIYVPVKEEHIEEDVSIQGSYSTAYDDVTSQCTSATNSRVNSDESSDEDYIPTLKKRRKQYTKRTTNAQKSRRTSINQEILSPKPVRRGRPIKVNTSPVSPDNSRYRELRDKNNEASRRSRLNRKLKEQHMEDEAQELAEKNIKLKAEVQQLEKLVSSMRSNLMQMLLKK